MSRPDPRISRARTLRQQATPAEKKLWLALRQLNISGHFRRQVPIGTYFADFAHHSLKLIIEIDGDLHATPLAQRYDAHRTHRLMQQGYQVVRFTNADVLHNIDGVMLALMAVIDEKTKKSPPPIHGGQGS